MKNCPKSWKQNILCTGKHSKYYFFFRNTKLNELYNKKVLIAVFFLSIPVHYNSTNLIQKDNITYSAAINDEIFKKGKYILLNYSELLRQCSNILRQCKAKNKRALMFLSLRVQEKSSINFRLYFPALLYNWYRKIMNLKAKTHY